MPFAQYHGRGTRPVLGDGADRQPQNGAHVQGELGEILRNQGHHAGIVGTGGDFAEPHFIAFYKELDSEQAVTTEGLDHLGRYLFGSGQRQLAHHLRLPGFAVVATFLTVADRIAEVNAIDGAYREQGDLVLEGDEAFDDHLATTGAAAFLGVGPALIELGEIAQYTLPLAGRTHHRFHHAGQADSLDCGDKLLFALGKTVG